MAQLEDARIWSAESAQRELMVPSTETFIDRAVEMSIDSRSEAKRRFIGRLIAKRLQSNGTDEYDMMVERALSIIGELSERELLALGAIAFVRNLGDPDMRFVDINAVEEWMTEHHARTVRAIESGPEWDDDTLEHLGQAGAVALHLRGGVATSEHAEHGDVLDTFLATHGLSLQALNRDNAGSPGYHAENRRRFPTMMAIQRISRGRQFQLGTALATYRLDDQYLTAAGEMLGEEILATLSRNFAQ